MIRRSTWVLLVLFLMVLGAAWGFQRYKTQQAAKATPTVLETNLFQVQENTLTSLRVENDQAKVIALGRDPQGMWVITEPKGSQETDTGQVESAVSQLLSLRPLVTMNMPDNLADYGLLKPSYTIILVSNGGEEHVLKIGAEARVSSGYYVQVDGSAPKVVDKYSLDAVTRMISYPPYKSTETPAPGLSGTPGATENGTGTPGVGLPTETPTPAP
jgi:hypothetical protein